MVIMVTGPWKMQLLECLRRTPIWPFICRCRCRCYTADSYAPAAFLAEVRAIALRQPLAQVRAGSHCGEEERGRHRKLTP